MIQPTDYRIGNLCLKEEFPGEGKKIWTIHAGDLYDHCQDGKPLPEPIPLTEDWLIKMGFTRSIQERGLWIDAATGWFMVQERDGYYKLSTPGELIGNQFKYVHQLQNLFFAICGQELTIKE